MCTNVTEQYIFENNRVRESNGSKNREFSIGTIARFQKSEETKFVQWIGKDVFQLIKARCKPEFETKLSAFLDKLIFGEYKTLNSTQELYNVS